jgi:hypothetical protein
MSRPSRPASKVSTRRRQLVGEIEPEKRVADDGEDDDNAEADDLAGRTAEAVRALT